MTFDPNGGNFIAGQFVNFYYRNILSAPATVLACYNDESTVQRFERAPVRGIENIKSELQLFPFNHQTIKQYDVVDHSEASLIIQVNLTIQIGDQAPREADQTFHVIYQNPSAFHIVADKMEDAQSVYDNSCQLSRLSISNVEIPQTSATPTSQPSSSFSQPTADGETYRCIAYKDY